MEPAHAENTQDIRARPAASQRPAQETPHQDDRAHRVVTPGRLGEPGAPVQNRTGVGRLTQYLSAFVTRRGFAIAETGLLLALDAEATASAKRKRKRKKKKRGPSHPNPTPTPPNPTCSPGCEHGYSCSEGECVCASDVLCDAGCCGADETCVRAECCPNTRVCAANCCNADEVCKTISPGGAKGCCTNPLVVRGENCCPTGSLETRLNCGSYQCAYALSGTGPGGCDLWCKVGVEGGMCGPGIPGFPAGDPGRGCCCGAIANPGVCTYPVPGNGL